MLGMPSNLFVWDHGRHLARSLSLIRAHDGEGIVRVGVGELYVSPAWAIIGGQEWFKRVLALEQNPKLCGVQHATGRH
jgi:hypothetical protein